MDARSLLETNGAFIQGGVISEAAVSALRREFAHISGRPGSRGFTLSGNIAELIGSEGPLVALARALGGSAMKPVRVLFFDKTEESNWAIPWHQDRTIAVEERVDLAGFGPWTVKRGVVHVEPPVALLEDRVTVEATLSAQGKVCATCIGTFVAVKPGHPAYHRW